MGLQTGNINLLLGPQPVHGRYRIRVSYSFYVRIDHYFNAMSAVDPSVSPGPSIRRLI